MLGGIIVTTILREKIEPMILDVERSLENETYHTALALALCLPDICSTMEFPQLKSKSKKRYILWIEKYFSELHDYGDSLNAADIYALRCAFLHNGSDNIEEQKARMVINRFQFLYPKAGCMIHRNYSNYNGFRTLQVDSKEFCLELLDAVNSFLILNENNEKINDEAKNILILEKIENGFYF